MAGNDSLAWADIEQVMEAARAFLDPVLANVRGSWDPTNWRWSV
jgi:hypothetical protein